MLLTFVLFWIVKKPDVLSESLVKYLEAIVVRLFLITEVEYVVDILSILYYL